MNSEHRLFAEYLNLYIVRRIKLVPIPEVEDEATVVPKPQESQSPSQTIVTRPLSEGPLYFGIDNEEWDASMESPADDLFGPLLQAREYYYGLEDECPPASEERSQGATNLP